jgi:hypothetical protein
MKKRINTVINGKGGVGKSFFAVNLVQFLKDRAIPHIAFDSDNENSTLKRFHREAVFLNIQAAEEIDSVLALLEKTDLAVVDCRAASTDIFLDYFDEVKIFDLLKTFGARLTIISPVAHETDSLEQIRAIAERLGDQCDYIIVKNQALTGRFTTYEQSKTRARLVNELGAKEIILPKLYDWLVASLNTRDLTIGAGVKHSEFTLMDRQRLMNWQKKFYGELETVQDYLLPRSIKPRKSKPAHKPALA